MSVGLYNFASLVSPAQSVPSHTRVNFCPSKEHLPGWFDSRIHPPTLGKKSRVQILELYRSSLEFQVGRWCGLSLEDASYSVKPLSPCPHNQSDNCALYNREHWKISYDCEHSTGLQQAWHRWKSFSTGSSEVCGSHADTANKWHPNDGGSLHALVFLPPTQRLEHNHRWPLLQKEASRLTNSSSVTVWFLRPDREAICGDWQESCDSHS